MARGGRRPTVGRPSTARTPPDDGPLCHPVEALGPSCGPLPVVTIAVATVAGVLLPRLDASVDARLDPWVTTTLVFAGDAGAACTVLDTAAGSLITVTSLTFSLTVVTLQLASSQFSPRLLRAFTSDVFVQATHVTGRMPVSYCTTRHATRPRPPQPRGQLGTVRARALPSTSGTSSPCRTGGPSRRRSSRARHALATQAGSADRWVWRVGLRMPLRDAMMGAPRV